LISQTNIADQTIIIIITNPPLINPRKQNARSVSAPKAVRNGPMVAINTSVMSIENSWSKKVLPTILAITMINILLQIQSVSNTLTVVVKKVGQQQRCFGAARKKRRKERKIAKGVHVTAMCQAGATRKASVRMVTPVRLWCLDRRIFHWTCAVHSLETGIGNRQ